MQRPFATASPMNGNPKPGAIRYIPSLTNLSASAFTVCPC